MADMYERACLHGWPLVGPDGEPDYQEEPDGIQQEESDGD